jgi:4-amino-4-deoxy-L-arabinose transferase-like glycosyltransferase
MKRLISALQSNRLFTLILIGYLVLAFGFSVVNPIYESTDELHQFRYVRYLQEFRALPEQREDQPRIQAHHPPLYYVIAAIATGLIPSDRPALYEPVHNPYYGYRYWEINNDNKNRYLHGPDEQWPYSGVVLMVHVARWVNIVIGAIMVWVTYRLALTVFPDRKSLASAAAAIVAFNPQFLFMSGAVNNDVIAGLFGSLLVWSGVTIIRCGLTTRRSIFLALTFALALMAKFNLAFALPLVELALIIAVWPRRDWRGFVKANLFIVLFVALIAGWWFVRNTQLYGEPTGVQRMNELWGGRNPAESFSLAVSEIPYAWSSFWGRFGYGQIPLPDAIYTGALIISLIGFVGLVSAFVRSFRSRHREAHPERSGAESKDTPKRSRVASKEIASRPSPTQQTKAAPLGTLAMTETLIFDRIQIKQLVLVIFSAFLFAAALFGYMLSSTAGPMGRFYFPGLSAFALLLSVGLTHWLSMLQDAGGKRHYATRIARYFIPVAAFVLALVAFFGYFVPAYAAPQKVAAASIAQPLNVTFDGQIELLGAEVDRVVAQPGDPIKVTMYWRALRPIDTSYVEFVHLIDEQGIMVAQRDTWPGRGMYPTTLWQPGEVIADSLELYVPDGAFAPNNATLKVGLYEQGGPRLTAQGGKGETFGDNAVPIGSLKIDPHPGEYPNALQVNFGNQVELLGYEMSPRSILPGEAITVTLYWRATAPFTDDYSVYLNALRPNQRTSAQDSSKPLRDTFSTQNWPVGQVITDVRVLQFPPHANPGELDIEVGWFLPKVGRLSVLAADGHAVDTRQLLSKIRIREK